MSETDVERGRETERQTDRETKAEKEIYLFNGDLRRSRLNLVNFYR